MTESARLRAAWGAAFLDVAVPGWFNKIDLKTFVISSCHKCVLGQLYDGVEAYESGFGTGLRALALNGNRPYLYGLGMFEGDEDIDNLQIAWVAEITDRLANQLRDRIVHLAEIAELALV